jgi:hypothetical protein
MYRSYLLAPDRVIWRRDNRGVTIRVLGGRVWPPKWTEDVPRDRQINLYADEP